MFEALAINAAILLAIIIVLWLISLKIDDVSFIDAFWGAGMGVMALTSYLQLPERGLVATVLMVMTCAWGFRLGIYLIRRWSAEGEDKRYKLILKKDREAGRFASAALTKVWLMQAVLLFAVSSPAQVGILAAGDGNSLGPLAWAGIAVFAIGIFFEWVGDWQLSRFKADPANQGKVLDTGLWRYTRHPNYFGDFMAWWGIWIVCASVGWIYAAATVIGPLFLSFTLTKWSGAPLLERGMAKTKGDKYADYKARTSPFFPRPPKS
jgi:steroid 5-alpha reductase family enzyme